MTAGWLVEGLNLAGTVAFALSGAAVGVRRRMDLFGVLVLAFVTAVAGGTLRDLLIGAVPPASMRDWPVGALAVGTGLFVFLLPNAIERLRSPVQLFDAAGLGIFAVTGTQKALEFGISPLIAPLLGVLTGIGGGMVRDVLTARIPTVLCGEIYALAALAGALVVAIGHALGLPATTLLLPGAALCVFLRLMAVYRGWNLPQARRQAGSPEE